MGILRLVMWWWYPVGLPPHPSSQPNCCVSLAQSLRPHQAAQSSRTCANTSSSKECIWSNPTRQPNCIWPGKSSRNTTCTTHDGNAHMSLLSWKSEIAPVHVSVEAVIVRNQFIQSLLLFPPLNCNLNLNLMSCCETQLLTDQKLSSSIFPCCLFVRPHR